MGPITYEAYTVNMWRGPTSSTELPVLETNVIFLAFRLLYKKLTLHWTGSWEGNTTLPDLGVRKYNWSLIYSYIMTTPENLPWNQRSNIEDYYEKRSLNHIILHNKVKQQSWWWWTWWWRGRFFHQLSPAKSDDEIQESTIKHETRENHQPNKFATFNTHEGGPCKKSMSTI